MTRGPRRAAHGKGEPDRQFDRHGPLPASAPFDLGIALSVYSKDPAGRLVEIQEAIIPPTGGDARSGLGAWPTEQ